MIKAVLALAVLGYLVGTIATAAAGGNGIGAGFVPPGLNVALEHVPSHVQPIIQTLIEGWAEGTIGAAMGAAIAAVAKTIGKSNW